MSLLYEHEHLGCLNYEKSKHPLIEKITLSSGQIISTFLQENMIAIIVKGSVHISFGTFKNKIAPEGKIILFQTNTALELCAEEPTSIILIRLRSIKQLCDCFPLDMLMCERENNFTYNFPYLDVNERMKAYIQLLDACVADGLKCIYYFRLKVDEFYFLLRAYYPKKDLFAFLYPILTHDLSFSDFVIKNHDKVKTVQELAALLHYSLSGFQKRFKKVFGVSAYHWMKEERSKSIYHKINSSNKPLKEICDDFGFSSLSHFNDFCKANFGTTPGRIRKKESALAK